MKYLLAAVFIALVGAGIAQDCGKPPMKVHPKECCAHPEMDDTMIKQCFADFKDQMGPPQGPPRIPACVAECILTKTNILKGGEIDKAAFSTYMNGQMGSAAEWAPVITTAVDTCTAAAAAKKADFDAKMEGKCSPMSSFLMGCTHRAIVLGCPASKWTSSDDCNAWKSFMEKCPPPS